MNAEIIKIIQAKARSRITLWVVSWNMLNTNVEIPANSGFIGMNMLANKNAIANGEIDKSIRANQRIVTTSMNATYLVTVIKCLRFLFGSGLYGIGGFVVILFNLAFYDIHKLLKIVEI